MITALAGMLYYQLQSWKNSGEPFNLAKFIDTAWSGGAFSIFASAVGLSQVGIDFSSEISTLATLSALSGAFGLAAGVDVAQNKVLAAAKKKSGG
jgi:hypothetical protein